MTSHAYGLREQCAPLFGTNPLLVPFNVPSADIFLSLLNLYIKTHGGLVVLTADQVTLGVPHHAPPGTGRDTEVIVTAKADSGLKGEIPLRYDRFDLAEYFVHQTRILSVNSPTTSVDLLATINRTYGLALTADDIQNYAVSGNSHRLVASAQSYVWRGSVVFTLVQIPDTPPQDITQSITVLTLSGFSYQ